jgi:hypothetical protein
MKGRNRLENDRLEIVDWILLAQDSDRWRALVNSLMQIQALLNTGTVSTKRAIISFSGKTLLHGFGFKI